MKDVSVSGVTVPEGCYEFKSLSIRIHPIVSCPIYFAADIPQDCEVRPNSRRMESAIHDEQYVIFVISSPFGELLKCGNEFYPFLLVTPFCRWVNQRDANIRLVGDRIYPCPMKQLVQFFDADIRWHPFTCCVCVRTQVDGLIEFRPEADRWHLYVRFFSVEGRGRVLPHNHRREYLARTVVLSDYKSDVAYAVGFVCELNYLDDPSYIVLNRR